MGSMLRKKDAYTLITPIPGFVPRQLAIDILHSHSEIITLNPLVLEHKPIKAPRDAASDEFYSTWYEITERVQVIPGIGKMGSSKISFNGCFHDMPWGLQTHIYAPMNIDLRTKYRIGGNQPGIEPPEVQEMGLSALGAPSDGLYLREDIEIKCNVAMVSFVKSQQKAANKAMVQRIIKKAELLDAGVLQAMMEGGKLKTINPADRTNTLRSPQPSPVALTHAAAQQSPSIPYQVPRPKSMQQYPRPGTSGSQGGYPSPHPSPGYPAPGYTAGQRPPFAPQELPVHMAPQAPVEMPGDYYHPPRPLGQDSAQPSPTLGSHRASTQTQSSAPGSAADYSSRPTSIASDASGYRSPALDKQFSSDLHTHQELEEHGTPMSQRRHTDQQAYTYNPADYVKTPMGQLSAAQQARYSQPAPYPPYSQQPQYR